MHTTYHHNYEPNLDDFSAYEQIFINIKSCEKTASQKRKLYNRVDTDIEQGWIKSCGECFLKEEVTLGRDWCRLISERSGGARCVDWLIYNACLEDIENHPRFTKAMNQD